jgi:hypothetical protein
VRINLNKSVSFDQLVIPRTEGKFVIPEFEWSYFSPTSGTYKTARTKPIEITVSGIAQGAAPIATQNSGQASIPESQKLVTEDIRYIKPTNQLLSKQFSSQLFNQAALAILALINLIFLSLWIYRGRAKFVPRSKEKLRKESLKRAMQRLNENSIEALENALLCTFESILESDCRGMTSEEIEAACNNKGVITSQSADLLQMLRQCHTERFSPDKKYGPADFSSRKKRLEKLLSELGLS